MYEAFFGLRERPFLAAPRSDHYLPLGTIEAARHGLARCIERAEGTGLVIGPSGTGKTLLLEVLAKQLAPRYEVVLLANGLVTTRRSLHQAILYALNQPFRLAEAELRLSLREHLERGAEDRAALVLLVDEAQLLPPSLLEELRLLTNVIRGGAPRVRLVLAGGPELEERLAQPRLEQFAQRVALRCYLEPLCRDDARRYVALRLAESGRTGEPLFTDEALERVAIASDGNPRAINQLCDHALILAYAGGRRRIDGAGINEAWEDLQQLPTPWSSAAAPSRPLPSGEEVIEFGTLDDDEPAPVRGATPPAAPATPLPPAAPAIAGRIESSEPLASPSKSQEIFVGSTPFRFQEPIAASSDWSGDEELVIDRYAEMDAGRGPAVPRVWSHEGRELWSMLAPFDQELPRRIDSRGASEPAIATSSGWRSEEFLAEVTGAPLAGSFPTTDELPEIVIEDEVIDPVSLPIAQRNRVQRMEYGQLFTRLRQG